MWNGKKIYAMGFIIHPDKVKEFTKVNFISERIMSISHIYASYNYSYSEDGRIESVDKLLECFS